MTKENQGQPSEVVEETTEEQGASVNESQNDLDTKIAEAVEKVKVDLESKYKKEIAGLNRKNTELQATVKEKELEGKTEAEQKEILLREKERIQNEIAELNRGRIIDKELSVAGLPLEFAKRIIGENEESIKEDIKAFSDFVEKVSQEKADKIISERLGGKPPEAGKTPQTLNLTPADIAQLPKEQRMEAYKKAGYK